MLKPARLESPAWLEGWLAEVDPPTFTSHLVRASAMQMEYKMLNCTMHAPRLGKYHIRKDMPHHIIHMAAKMQKLDQHPEPPND